MRGLCIFAIAASLAPLALAQSPGDAAAACEVWDRETSFAQTVVDHDAAAFASHLHPGAVFIGGDGNGTHGREAIVAEWAGLIDGKGLVLRWYPDAVDVSGDAGGLCASRTGSSSSGTAASGRSR